MKARFLFICVVVLLAFFSVQSTHATVIFSVSGTSAKDVDVTFEARLTISGDDLTVILTNDSPVDSLSPADVLGSFYFDILNSVGVRPTLTYFSATGDTYKGVKNGADALIKAGADLRAVVANDDSWQFKNFDATFNPFLGFGIGTVGNSNLSPNGFNGNVVDGVNFAIYKGEITTQPLVNPDCLVKDTATFIFTGLTGFTERDIVNRFTFGLGTAPDSLLVPELATICLLGLGGLAMLRRRKSA